MLLVPSWLIYRKLEFFSECTFLGKNIKNSLKIGKHQNKKIEEKNPTY